MKVKICGITNYDDAIAAIDAGADYLGFIFHERSPRYIAPDAAREIIARLPRGVKKVGVFVNSGLTVIEHAVADCGLDLIQLHGDEPPAFAVKFPRAKIWKAVHIVDADEIDRWRDFPAAALVLDSRCGDLRGGTGSCCDWRIAANVVAMGINVMLAGGINPDNAVYAAETVRPWGIDVNSGVESAPGKKDHEKIKVLMNNLKNAGLK